MEKSLVALIPCKSYDENLVNEAVKQGIDLIGGISSLINKDEKILVKPNLLVGATPDKAITTHPSVFGALLKYLTENGYRNLTYGDSNSQAPSTLNKTVETSGLAPKAEKYGAKLGNFFESVTVSYSEGKAAKKFNICKAVDDADAIISVCKMKTHALVNITGAMKNQYGCIFASNKAIGHAKFPNSVSFSKMLTDLNMYLKPRLYIMDGIIAMEGNGPGSGDPVLMNTILVSKDPVALDTVFATLVNLDPNIVPTIVYGYKYGLGNMKEDDISIVNPEKQLTFKQAYDLYGNPNFVVNRNSQKFWRIKSLIFKSKKPKHRPVVDLDKCIGCGICNSVCPVEGKAVQSGGGKKAVYDYSKCIRCYCCQEMCPEKAITRIN